jgi:hypothetical protein
MTLYYNALLTCLWWRSCKATVLPVIQTHNYAQYIIIYNENLVMYLLYCNFCHYFRVYFYLLRKGLLEKDNGMLFLQLSALFRLLSITGHSYWNLMQRRYKLLPQWQQSRPKTFLVDWRLCVASYCPTTPTEYSSKSVGPPVDVNIQLCGYLHKHFWSTFKFNL